MGKSTPSIIVGYEYRLGLHVVLGVHPINAIHEIRCDNKVFKQGTFSGGTLDIDNPTFFEGGEVSDGMAGSIDLHIDGDPEFNAYLRNNYGIPFERVPRFDQVAHLVFRGTGSGEGAGGYYIGNQPRPREMTVFAERVATQCPYDEWALLPYTHPKWNFEVNDFNPLVMHWEMLIRGNPDAYGDTWAAAAEVLHGENFGISASVGGGDREALEQDICRYINARTYTDRATGLREIRLIRNDYEPTTLTVIGEGDIIGEPQVSVPDRSQAVNTLDITYSDRAKMWDKASVTVQDGAHVEVFGVNRKAVDYKWVTRRALAADLGWRDVVAQTQAGVMGSIRVSGLRPDLNEGSPFILDLPSYGQSTVVCRIVSIKERGVRDNSVDVSFVADVFGTDVDPIVEEDVPSSGDSSGGGDTGTLTEALPAPTEAAVEVPYWFGVTSYGSDFTAALAADDDFGAVMTAASAPSGVYLGYDAWLAVGAGTYAKKATGPFAGSGSLVGAITRMQTYIVTTPISGLVVGHVLLIGGTEFVRVDAITTGSTYTLTVGRGCIDTAPVAHADGAEVLSMARALPIAQEYTAGQTVNAKLLTFLSGDTMDIGEATALPVTMDSRAIRPYPPGQFKVDGSYDDGATLAADPVLTWVARNRLVQTDETHADDHDEAGITAEGGTTYVVRAEAFNSGGASLGYVTGFSGLDVGSVLTYTPALTAATKPSGTSAIALSVASKRDGWESWTAPSIRVAVSDDLPTVPLYNMWPSYTEEFQHVIYDNLGVTVTANAFTAPDGATTMDRIQEQATFDYHGLRRNVPVAAGVNRISIFAKADGRNRLLMMDPSAGFAQARFNLDDGTVATSAVNTTASIEPVSGLAGVYLCTIQFPADADAEHTIWLMADTTSNDVIYSGNSSLGIALWGASLTYGSTPRPYQRVGATTADVSQPAIPGMQTAAQPVP